MNRYVSLAARILLGLLFTVTGLNGFLNFLPQPSDPMPQGALDFAGAMMKTGYFMQLVAGTQLIGGLLLVSNFFVPLALTLLAPVVLNILAFHVFLAPSGIGLALAVVALEGRSGVGVPRRIWTYARNAPAAHMTGAAA